MADTQLPQNLSQGTIRLVRVLNIVTKVGIVSIIAGVMIGVAGDVLGIQGFGIPYYAVLAGMVYLVWDFSKTVHAVYRNHQMRDDDENAQPS